MKKAVYYARVSTSLQEEKGTIESQKSELVQQIKSDGNILVKEYVDNGWSGGRLDRPALDELRNDLKEDNFDVIYFLDADRIARDVAYQNIIISELIKADKQIVIRGKDYIQNPENKFNLTVMGAVNELEKAKIVERLMRGRRERARQGGVVAGSQMFGYTYVKKTENKKGYFVVNEAEAEIVRLMFETYANTDMSTTGLLKFLEEKNIKTKNGKTKWARSSIKNMLKNTSYYGVQYYNRTERVESDNVIKRYAKNVKTKVRVREENEWIPVQIPPIIEKDLFDRVQSKIIRNYKLTRGNGRKYLLSTLIKCGVCNHTYTGYTEKKWDNHYYRCNFRTKGRDHSEEARQTFYDCDNKQVSGKKIEEAVWKSIEDKILQPGIIKGYIEVLKSEKGKAKGRLEDLIRKLEKQINSLDVKRQRLLDLYADGNVSKEDYINKINDFKDSETRFMEELKELKTSLSRIGSRKELKRSLNDFCKLAKKRLKKLDFDKKKQFLLQVIESITINDNKLKISGFIPILEGGQSTPSKCWPRHTCNWSGGGFTSVRRENDLLYRRAPHRAGLFSLVG